MTTDFTIKSMEEFNRLPEEEIRNALLRFGKAEQLLGCKDRYALVIISRNLPVRGAQDKDY